MSAKPIVADLANNLNISTNNCPNKMSQIDDDMTMPKSGLVKGFSLGLGERDQRHSNKIVPVVRYSAIYLLNTNIYNVGP